MKISSAAILIASVTTASAQLGKDASYFCTAEIAGGLAYDEGLKKWKGTGLRTEQKFVLRLRYLNSRKVGGDQTVYDYDVTVTTTGTNNALPCARSGRTDRVVPVNNNSGILLCDTSLHNYRFNLRNNRFVSASLIGYIFGGDNNEGPYAAGGTCTKID